MVKSKTSLKQHLLILDGMRGIAALLVVIFHFGEALKVYPIQHGYLAVDFFFLLSGFVIGYAYNERWKNMTIISFFKIRLIRLHPMVIYAVLIGIACFIFDPNNPSLTIFMRQFSVPS